MRQLYDELINIIGVIKGIETVALILFIIFTLKILNFNEDMHASEQLTKQ